MRFFSPAAIAVLVTTVGLAGCLSGPGSSEETDDALGVSQETRAWLHDGGLTLNLTVPLGGVANVSTHYVGQDGPEPTLGVTSNGHIFFVALSDVLRSTDGGDTWEVVSTPVSSPVTLDPMLWVDPDTDRVFSDQLYLGCSYLSYSDDYGESWVTNPIACGLPVNDHQKLATGPYAASGPLGPAAGMNPVYRNAVYYAYNQIAGGRVAISLDGGLSFPYTAATFTTTCDPPVGGLHGHVTAGPDGAVYIPARNCGGPLVARSMDNGLTWSQVEVHPDVGTARCDKNPEVAIDSENNVYLVWPGSDNLLYLSTSADHAQTWGTAHRAAPGDVQTATMPVIVAGDPGRVAFAYYGTKDSAEAPDEVDEDALWHLFYAYSTNALEEEPVFTTIQLTPDDDPVQVGPISTNGCGAPAGSRNLLDFIDIVADLDGRPYVAFADGCLACDLADMTSSRDAEGVVAILQDGPGLWADEGNLTHRKDA